VSLQFKTQVTITNVTFTFTPTRENEPDFGGGNSQCCHGNEEWKIEWNSMLKDVLDPELLLIRGVFEEEHPALCSPLEFDGGDVVAETRLVPARSPPAQLVESVVGREENERDFSGEVSQRCGDVERLHPLPQLLLNQSLMLTQSKSKSN
jgi:hypothetical protein